MIASLAIFLPGGEPLSYETIGRDKDCTYNTSGYYAQDDHLGYLLTIAEGEQPSTSTVSHFDVLDVTILGDLVVIQVGDPNTASQTSPRDPNRLETSSLAFSCPIVQIRLNRAPRLLHIHSAGSPLWYNKLSEN